MQRRPKSNFSTKIFCLPLSEKIRWDRGHVFMVYTLLFVGDEKDPQKTASFEFQVSRCCW